MGGAVRQIAVCAAALTLFCLVCRLAVSGVYYVRMPLNGADWTGDPVQALSFTAEPEGIVEVGDAFLRRGCLIVPVRPLQSGTCDLLITDARTGVDKGFHVLLVGRFRTVYDRVDGGFTGDVAVLIAVTFFWLLVSLIMIWNFSRARGAALYSYTAIYFSGFSLFAVMNLLLMLRVTVGCIAFPAGFSMLSAYSVINGAAQRFMLLTMPLIIVFAVAMSISNAALLRHERPRVQNVLGILISLLLIAGDLTGVYFTFQGFSGSAEEMIRRETLLNVYATAFVYFECMLAGSVICGIRAARYEPAPDKDFIVILGCWFRRDGTLPPLLKGRADRSVEFWRKQKELTGREAILIPSGGQGPDETMPEAEAIRRYLIAQGIPEALIRPEDRSRNTYQNMEFSRKIAMDIDPEGKAAFVTTNYHVFRSGVWAARAGFPAEGIGSGTRWWYWPNAFMRECAGLLQRRWIQEVLFLVFLAAFYGVLSLVLV